MKRLTEKFNPLSETHQSTRKKSLGNINDARVIARVIVSIDGLIANQEVEIQVNIKWG